MGKNIPEVVSLKSPALKNGNVLLSYLISPFLLRPDETFPLTHTNYWECFEMAQTFLDFGYDVDVINWDNKNFIPKENYSILIDIHLNLERLAPLLNQDCIKILHITGSHWLFQNQAEYTRLLALQQRRCATLSPQRIVPPSLGIEYADYGTMVGNQVTLSTYSYAGKEIYTIPVSTNILFPWQENKNPDKCRNKFLWLGGSGMVHKGLDLVLEAFSQNPEFQLTVCGPIDNEKDFKNAFYTELYQTDNIKTVGWVDINSEFFQELINDCVGLVYPSCSEGCAGSVITCMHAGLIPIVSYQSGVDIFDFGIYLEECTSNNIIKALKKLSSLSSQQLIFMSRKTWEYAREHHTRDNFSLEYKKAVASILKKRGIHESAL